MTPTEASRLPGELRVLAVRLEALGMNARPLWDAAKLAAAHAKEETPQETRGFTAAQAHFARQQMSRWLRIKFAHEGAWVSGESEKQLKWKDVPEVSQLLPDIDHSALLLRLLQGHEPLPEPPPLKHAYPVYPDEETEPTEQQDAGLSAEREAEIRDNLSPRHGAVTIYKPNEGEIRELLAALDAERDRRSRAEQQAETLAEALEEIELDPHARGAATRRARRALAGYRAGRDEAKP